jgi:hypothetical protein
MRKVGKSSVRNRRGSERTDLARVRAITRLGLYIEDVHTRNKDIALCYLDFKGAFPYADHDQLVRTLVFLGLPDDFVNIISNVYNGATAEFVTPHGHAPPSGFAAAPYKKTPSPHYSLTS